MRIRILLLAIFILSVFAGAIQAQTEEPELLEFSSEGLTFSYEPGLFSQVTEEAVAETPYDEASGMPYWAAGPAYTRYILMDFADEMDSFQLPIIHVFPTENLAAYGNETVYTFQGQLEALNALLAEEELDLSTYAAAPTTSGESDLPFLPLLNAAQVFRAQPEVMEFQNGRGIRYLTYYSQAPGPIMNQNIFYTFQGVTDDGKYYVSATFPINTGLFEDEFPGQDFDFDAFMETYNTYLQESLTSLNELPVDAAESTPTIAQLDALINSLTVGE